jgi:hypothetical protein
MEFEDKIVEFMIQPENLDFILQLEPYITKAKEKIAEKNMGAFKDKMQELSIENCKQDFHDETFVISFNQTKVETNQLEKYFKHGIFIGPYDKNFLFGIIGPKGGFNTYPSEAQEIKKILTEQKMKWDWPQARGFHHWAAWKFFDRQRSEMIHSTKETAVEDFSECAMNEFSHFVEITKVELEKLNNCIT